MRGEDTKAYEAEFLGEFFKVNQAEAGDEDEDVAAA